MLAGTPGGGNRAQRPCDVVAFELRIDALQESEPSRFKDGVTTYEGRKVKLPSFWLTAPGGTEKFTLSLTNMIQVCQDASAAQGILRRLGAELEMDLGGVDAAALVLQSHCREVAKWKPITAQKRDVQRRMLPAHLRGRFR